MKIEINKLFPYPILRENNKNFISGIFKAAAEYRHNDFEYEVDLAITLDEKNLKKLLDSGDVDLICHIECAKTKFRLIEPLKLGENRFRLQATLVDGKLDLIILLIANRNIEKYNSKNFHPDYSNTDFFIERGSILGVAEIPTLYVENKKENLSNLPSIFDITYSTEEKTMLLSLNEQRLKIILPINEYRIRSAHKDSILSRNIMNTMIVLPALVGVLNDLSHKDSIEMYGDLRWFGILKKKLARLGCKIEEGDLEDSHIFTLAQQLAEDLFPDAMDSLRYLEERGEE